MKKLMFVIALTLMTILACISFAVGIRPKEFPTREIGITKETDVWRPKAFAPPNAFLLFVFLNKATGNGKHYKAIMILESETKFRLIGGIAIHKDIPKSIVDGLMIVSVRYTED